MIRTTRLVAAALLCLAAAPLRTAAQGIAEPPRYESTFELSISQIFMEKAASSIAVTVSIPYRRLVFFARGSHFESRYRVYLALKGKRGAAALGEVWEESVATGSFTETTSIALAATTRRTFAVPPGEYTATVTVEVVDTSRRMTETQPVRVVGEGTGRLEISTPQFQTETGDSLSPKPRDGEIAVRECGTPPGQAPRINPDGVYGDFDAWARAACNVVMPSKDGGRGVTLSARVVDAQGRTVRYARRALGAVGGGHAVLCLDLNFDSMDIGAYRLDAVVETADGAQRSEALGKFTILFNRGLLETHPADLVTILSLFADKKDAQAIADAPPAERIKAWSAFWKKRDTTPSTQANEAFGEFLRRLQFVLTSFSKHGAGWRTDMGKTYLANGAPDKVEDRQDASTGRSYQLWYYNGKGLVYIFEDTIGNGEYHLVTTQVI